MKFFGMVAALALVSTVAFANDDHKAHEAAPAASAAATDLQKAGEKVEMATKDGGKKMAKKGAKAKKAADKAANEVKEEAADATKAH